MRMRVGGSLGYSDHEMVEFRILHGRSRVTSRVITWTSGGPTLASSNTCVEESHELGLWKAVGSKGAGQYSRATSSELKVGAPPGGRSQAEEPGDAHG